jgi:hypothetical protein
LSACWMSWRRKEGVRAFCRSGAGSRLSKPRRRDQREGSSLSLFVTCRVFFLEIAPKRRSQEACGFADRGCNHWASRLAKKDSRLAPGSGAVEGQECAEEKVALELGNVTEVLVILESHVGAEVGPMAPDLVSFAGSCFASKMIRRFTRPE